MGILSLIAMQFSFFLLRLGRVFFTAGSCYLLLVAKDVLSFVDAVVSVYSSS